MIPCSDRIEIITGEHASIANEDQAVEPESPVGAMPGFELLEMDPDSLVLVPVWHEPAAPAIAEEVGFQPAGQAVFAGRPDESIGDEHKRPIGERHALSLTEHRVEDGPQPELVEQCPDGEDRSPGGGVVNDAVFDLGGVRWVPAKASLELG